VAGQREGPVNLPKVIVGLLVLAAIAHNIVGGTTSLPPAAASSTTVSAGALAPDQIGQVAAEAGFAGYGRSVAVAIAGAESGGRPDAVGDGGTSFGLWQIHVTAHPDVSRECALDPPCAARATFRISRAGTDWTAWTTYTSGAYLAFMPAAATWRTSQ